MSKLVLQVNDLTKKYSKHTVVDSVSFDGYAGEVLGFLGPNGAGKTTTIKMITGLIKKNGGSVKISGFDTDKDFEKAMSAVGATPESPYLYDNMTGWQNLLLFATLKRATHEHLTEIVKITGLENHLKQKVKGYSLGMRQRLGIGIALLGSPSLLILDEPTNGLDPAGILSMRELLRSLAKDKNVCILVSSHMLLEMQKICDRVVIIASGKTICTENVAQLEAQGKTIEAVFLQRTGLNNIVE